MKTLISRLWTSTQEYWYFELRGNTPFKQIRDAYWWCMHCFVPKHRYNVIYLDLKASYYDPDIRLKHAMFEELCKFLDKAQIDWSATSEHQARYSALKEVYDWWRTNRALMLKEEDRTLTEWYDFAYGNKGIVERNLKEIPGRAFKSKELLDKHFEVELLIKNTDKKYMKVIVDNLDYLWYP